MPNHKNLLKGLSSGDRVELVWDDALINGEIDTDNAITCCELGYFGGSDHRGVIIWREIDEQGEFRWDLRVPFPVIRTIRRIGPRPRFMKKYESA